MIKTIAIEFLSSYFDLIEEIMNVHVQNYAYN